GDGSTAAVSGTPPLWTLPINAATDYACVVTNSGQPAPDISIVKSATPSDADSYAVGQVIEYSFVVTNTGNVPLNDITVTDFEFNGVGPVPTVSCPAEEAALLVPGAQLICTASYTLEVGDVDRGNLENSASATGTPPDGLTPPEA